MIESRRRKYIIKIIEDLKLLNGHEFEQFSYIIGEAFLKRVIHKRGLTLEGNPVGYTLDAYTDDLRNCIEASAEQNYFNAFTNDSDGDGSKMKHDIDHALKKAPSLKEIILFSDQECSNTQANNVSLYVNKRENENNITIHWFDARKISEYIVDNLLDENILMYKNSKLSSDHRRLFVDQY